MQVQIRGEFPHVLDSTIVAESKGCEAKGYYSFVRQLGSLYPSIDLIAGGAFAKGLEVFRKHFYGLEAHSFEHSLREAFTAAILEYGDVEVPEHKVNKSPERVLEALVAYFERWPPASDHLKPHMVNGVPQVEFTFSIPLPITHPDTGHPLIYAGRFDMLALYNGQLVVDDEKTTSQLGPSWKAKWNLRAQFTGYCWAAREYGLPVIGAVVRGISFLKNSFGTEEVLQLRPDWMINQWYAQLLVDVERMKKSYVSGWYSQDFGDACADYSGCPFQKLCTSHDPDNWVEGNYAKRMWNPLSKVPEAQPEQKIESVALPEGIFLPQ